jgi:ribosome-associated translation inhibitor RaiA
MKITISCKNEEFRVGVEAEIEKHIPKLEKFLTHYAPDLVHLHATFEKHPRKAEFTLSLNLSMPTATLHDVGEGADARSSVKSAFDAMEAQVKRHQEKLRKDHDWQRRGSPGFEPPGEESPAD